MARVTCYLPDELKELAEGIEPPVNFSELLRYGVIDKLAEARELQGDELERRAS